MTLWDVITRQDMLHCGVSLQDKICDSVVYSCRTRYVTLWVSLQDKICDNVWCHYTTRYVTMCGVITGQDM